MAFMISSQLFVGRRPVSYLSLSSPLDLCDVLCLCVAIASSISQSKTASTQSLAETRSNGDASKSRRNKDVGLLGALRTLLFGARDPESDLSIEMLEELHMVTGCK